MEDEKVVEILNRSFKKDANPSVTKLSGGSGKGKIIEFDRENGRFTMKFCVDDSFSNGKKGTKAQVQGGFASAMLDSVCANAIVAFSKLTQTVATLEQKVTFIKPVPTNTDLFATAILVKKGRKIAFLEGELRETTINGTLLAKSSQTCSLITIPRRENLPKASSKL